MLLCHVCGAEATHCFGVSSLSLCDNQACEQVAIEEVNALLEEAAADETKGA